MARRFVIAALFPEKHPEFIAYAQALITCWTGNTIVPSPPVSISAATALLTTLTGAQALALKKGAGAATARNTARGHVEVAFRQWEAYAEGILSALSPEDAASALTTLGFHQKHAGKSPKQAYTVVPGKLAGTMNIDVKALGRHGTVQYCHSYSINGGTTWVDWPPTLDTKLTITGLPVGVAVQFKWRSLIKGVYGNPSQTLTVTVH